MNYSEETWQEIRKLYESGVSPLKISRDRGEKPHHQTIIKRAKKHRWAKPGKDLIRQAKAIDSVKDRDRPLVTSEAVTLALSQVRQGMPRKLALEAHGISESYHSHLMGSDPSYRQAFRRAELDFVAEHMGNIAAAGRDDWKASEKALTLGSEHVGSEKASGNAAGGLKIILNINREDVVPDFIDSEVVD